MNWFQRIMKLKVESRMTLIEQAVWSDALRPVTLRRLQEDILAHTDAFTDPRRPVQVRRDRTDVVWALFSATVRALERKQMSRQILHNVGRVLLATNVRELLDDRLKSDLQKFAQKHEGKKPPWTMVISPTNACNLRCTGCYASAQENGGQLEWEIFDRIITEAKTLWGIRFFTISGGEPLVYRSQGRGLLDAARKHNDCFFMFYTNGTLIDEKVATSMAGAGNLIPAISVEGFESRTDQRRGSGVFQRILSAMANLRRAQVPFGISLTATRHNAEELLSDEFIDFFFDKQQALYGWLFQYMPIGRGYTLDLLPTPEQRLWMWHRTWQIIRERRIPLIDFWNCGSASEGCIAAGTYGGYLYIDWNGKVMPCVFVPYAAANIHDIYRRGRTLDDVYDLPYFRAIRQWQWDYGLGKSRPADHGNWLLPCSLRDHYGVGRELIARYHPEPEDEAAAEALNDHNFCDGMLRYDQCLREVFDPVWRDEYIGGKNPKHPIQNRSMRENAEPLDLSSSTMPLVVIEAMREPPRNGVIGLEGGGD